MLTAPRRLEVRQVDEPQRVAGDAVVRMRAAGICGTDLGIFDGKIRVAYPRIMGHEAVGDVVWAPEGAPGPGTRVIVDPSVACGRCGRCLEGRSNLCPEGWLLGRDRDGILCETVAVPAGNLHPVPDHLEDRVVPLIQVLTTCVHGQRMVQVFPGDSTVVVGLGVTGLLHLQLAKLRGARPVIGVSRSRAKLELARELGADHVVAADGRDAVETVRELTGGGPDVAFECAGVVATLATAVRMARLGGRVLAYGTIAESEGRFPFYDLYYKELLVVSSRAARPMDFPIAIDAAGTGRIRLGELVTRRVGLGGLAEALGTGDAGLKTIVEF